MRFIKKKNHAGNCEASVALWQTLREKNKLTCGSQEKKNRIGLLMRRRASFSWEVVRKRLRTEAAERQRLVCVIAALTYPFSNVFFPKHAAVEFDSKKKREFKFLQENKRKDNVPNCSPFNHLLYNVALHNFSRSGVSLSSRFGRLNPKKKKVNSAAREKKKGKKHYS